MNNLRKRFDRFCFANRDKGIPNLMLYIVLGCGLVSVLSLLGYSQLYSLLCFDRPAILRGEIWRLFTYAFTMGSSNIFTTLILLYCMYSLGAAVERVWGSFRFNLFYFTGIILMDIFAMVLGGITITAANVIYSFDGFYSQSMISYLHLSLLIAFATLYPDTQFYLFFILPIRAWILAAVYLFITLFQVVNMSIPQFLFPHNLFPLVAIANYFLFFGKDVKNILPPILRAKRRPAKKTVAKVVPFPGSNASATAKSNYSHRCTVCGRTDVSNPELEFRYCSRCNGYHCYCLDHINNHTHME